MTGDEGNRSRTPVVLAVLAVLALVATTVALIGSDDTDPAADTRPAASTTTSTTSEPDVDVEDLTGPARELADLLAHGRTTTYHARYTGSSTADTDSVIVLESWADDGRFRQDTVVDVAGESFHRSNFVLGDTAVACTRVGDVDWTCDEQPAETMSGTAALTGASLDQLRQAAVGETEKQIDGRSARCFAITVDAQTTELCTDADGVPLRISTRESQLMIDLLEHDVDETVFTPPASP